MNQADPILLNKQCNQQAFMVLHAVGAGIAFLSFASLCVFHTYLQVRARARATKNDFGLDFMGGCSGMDAESG